MGSLRIQRSQGGELTINVRGSGNARLSVVLRQFLDDAPELGNHSATIDLHDCEGCDSTFLGCLVGLCRGNATAVTLAAPSPQVRKILQVTRLEKVLPLREREGTERIGGTTVEITEPKSDLAAGAMAKHILDCHRKLLETSEGHGHQFTSVVKRLENELADQ